MSIGSLSQPFLQVSCFSINGVKVDVTIKFVLNGVVFKVLFSDRVKPDDCIIGLSRLVSINSVAQSVNLEKIIRTPD